MNETLVEILLVEDDEVDVINIRRTLDNLNVGNPITVADDGVSALNILRNIDENQQYPAKNFIIFLDLNMPRMSGLDFLKEIRRDDKLKNIPVFIFTTSELDSDIVSSFELDISGYIVKSDMHAALEEVINNMGTSKKILFD